MTITVKKAGEKLAKAVVQSNAPRAITAAEAPHVPPAKASTTTSMQPWNNWFNTALRDFLGEERYKKYRNFAAFMPDDIYDLSPVPKPSQKIPISKTDPTITAEWRYPSPGSQKPVRMPQFDLDMQEDPYDSGYFKRDTRRRHLFSELANKDVEKLKLEMMDPDDPSVVEEKQKVEAGPVSSPGNKGVFATGPTDFDPTGLRATMSATWGALEKSLDAHMPNHLPKPVWKGKEDEIIQWYKERDLPVPVGGYYEALKTPVYRRVARW
ncbi:hypothetical protein FisN_26Lh038 [Fistulifera solaris]|uniref:Uncharacterized protein n=1 Tax=Fistulifera solaris TaxID=1519565 RepID=A0A1Z5KCI7_FISSO|nr:hypothetical protein FisN_26Lh038 [Fistulifera solaris]|eukprot:GAX23979.1 hypothetical protein FisN_26Lh038 [Fistulifera solaris]